MVAKSGVSSLLIVECLWVRGRAGLHLLLRGTKALFPFSLFLLCCLRNLSFLSFLHFLKERFFLLILLLLLLLERFPDLRS